MKRIPPALLLMVLLAASPTTLADTLVVRTAIDLGAHSLRELIANARDGDVVTFELPVGEETITLSSELLISGKSITIDGFNRTQVSQEYVTLQVQRPGRSQFRVFNIQPGYGRTVTLMHLKLRGGDVSSIRRSPDGGTILVGETGALTLMYCDVRDGKAQRGGGLYAGGISSVDMLRMEHCIITRNQSIAGKSNATGGGGVYVCFGKTDIRTTRIHDNVSETHSGGICLFNASGVFVDSDIVGNSAKDADSKEGSFTGPSLFFFNTTLNTAVDFECTPIEAALIPPIPEPLRMRTFPTLVSDGEPTRPLPLLKGDPLHH